MKALTLTIYVMAAISCATLLFGQRGMGELRLMVTGPTGEGLAAEVELTSEANQFEQRFHTNGQGEHIAEHLPFGLYRLSVSRQGFVTFSKLVEIRSEIPLECHVALRIAPVETRVEVTDAATLLSPSSTGTVAIIGSKELDERPASLPGRAIIDLIAAQPGWLLEANGVLHPRGAEYGTQYVLDGVPILNNRSPAFAPGLDPEEFQTVRVLTADYPAEFGNRLGGVVELTTASGYSPGFHGKALVEGGSFATEQGYWMGQYARGRTTASLSLEGSHTKRYLDPPVEQNFTNKASGAGFTATFERELSQTGRLNAYVEHKRIGFLVPNELVQEQAGQRQDRDNDETLGLVSYQHVFSPHVMAVVNGMGQYLTDRLWSNPSSIPMLASQNCSFGEGYASANLAANFGEHELKTGAEVTSTSLRESFAYQITQPDEFDPGTPLNFSFAGSHRGWEPSLYAQDLYRRGPWTLSAGLRWDDYRLLVKQNALSPRLGTAWYWPAAGMVFHASYDRVFEIPATENLLLASSSAAQHLTGSTTGLPVPPASGNFYQAGFSKGLFQHLRLDANYFRRNIRNFADDDVFLNTGVSFPIAFSRAEIYGFEGTLEAPRWGRFSGFLNYSNLVGTGFLPITGGLFLDQDSASLLHSTESFPVSQDQRNTFNGRIRFQASRKFWLALAAHYGSGLPIEGDFDTSELQQQFSSRILDRVDFARGRVKPWYALDASFGVDVWKHEDKSVNFQADVSNLTGALNVINFASLFSGTALYPPRAISVRLETRF